MITQKYLKEILDYNLETGIFTWKKRRSNRISVGDKAGSVRTDGYTQISIDDDLYLAHRLVCLYVKGNWPEHHMDHINGIRSDDRFSNLREASNAENTKNRIASSRNTSGYKGVVFDKKRNCWISQIKCMYKNIHLGRFKNKEDAAKAYDKAALKYHGKFAKLNLPRIT